MMAYFNGDIHGWNDSKGYHSGAKCTRVLCDECAEQELPLKPRGTIGRHWDTGFKWAPHFGGKCHACDVET